MENLVFEVELINRTEDNKKLFWIIIQTRNTSKSISPEIDGDSRCINSDVIENIMVILLNNDDSVNIPWKPTKRC